MPEIELPAENNPFGRKHLLKELAIALVLGTILIGGMYLVYSTSQRMIDAAAAGGDPDATDPENARTREGNTSTEGATDPNGEPPRDPRK